MAGRAQSAEQLAERLARIDLSRPKLDKRRAERAVAAHLAALGIGPKPVRWIEDPARMGDRRRSPGSDAWLYGFSRKQASDRQPALARPARGARPSSDGAAGSTCSPPRSTDLVLFHVGIPSAVYDTAPYRISFSALVSRYAITCGRARRARRRSAGHGHGSRRSRRS